MLFDRLKEKTADLGRVERYMGAEKVQAIVEQVKELEQVEKRLKRTNDRGR